MSASPNLLVFSDLDGTLLDHRTYSWSQALPGLERLVEIGAGLILASSKTASEIAHLKDELGIQAWPAIVENGAGILWPGESKSAEDVEYQRILQALRAMPDGFHGFADMGAREVARVTGLAPEAAERACKRQFSEPGLWRGSDEDREAFLEALEKQGLKATQGGRFLTISAGKTKAVAMAEIVEKLRPAKTIALGDAPNDREMIELADFGVIVANSSGSTLEELPSERDGRTIRTTREGPQGWADAILSLTSDDMKT